MRSEKHPWSEEGNFHAFSEMQGTRIEQCGSDYAVMQRKKESLVVTVLSLVDG